MRWYETTIQKTKVAWTATKDTCRAYTRTWQQEVALLQTKITSLAACSTQAIKGAPFTLYAYIVESSKYYWAHPSVLKNEVLGGISIAFMQVPESVAFSFVARISPVHGLYSTFFIGLFGGLLTSLPGMVSGIAGGMVAIIKEVTSDDGPLGDRCLAERIEWSYAIMAICAIIQLVLGVLGVARFIKLLPHAVMVGFMNGLAIIIFRSQLNAFQTDDSSQSESTGNDTCPALDFESQHKQRWLGLGETQTWQVLALVTISMAITTLQPRIKGRIRVGRLTIGARAVPASLTAMIVCTLVSKLIYDKAAGRPVRTIGDMARFPGSVPQAHIPDVPWASSEFWVIVLRYAPLLAVVGLIESVMTWQMCQRIIGTPLPPSFGAFEAVSQGVGNLISAFFESIGGSVMVGQTVINYMNGARGRVSTTVAAFLILLFVSVAGVVIEMVPVAALTGIMFVVVLRTFEWRSLVYIFRISIPVSDIITVILVTVLAVTTDLAIAVLIGVAWSSVVLAWNIAYCTSIKTDHYTAQPESIPRDPLETPSAVSVSLSNSQVKDHPTADCSAPSKCVVVRISGPVFFGTAMDLSRYFTDKARAKSIATQDVLILDLSHATVYDSSGIEVLKEIARSFVDNSDGRVYMCGLDSRSTRILGKSRRFAQIIVDGEWGDAPIKAHRFDAESLRVERCEYSGWVGGCQDGRLRADISNLIESVNVPSRPDGDIETGDSGIRHRQT